MDAKATGGLIARRRKEKNWSQGELTEWLHVTDKAVSRWETGWGGRRMEIDFISRTVYDIDTKNAPPPRRLEDYSETRSFKWQPLI